MRPAIVIGFTALMLLFVALSVAYGMNVEYRFDVAAITVDLLVVASTLLALVHRRELNLRSR